MNESDLRGDPPKWAATKNRSWAYHDNDDCQALDSSEVRRATLTYIEWHDLTPCQQCHDSLTADPAKDESSSVAKAIRYGETDVAEVLSDD